MATSDLPTDSVRKEVKRIYDRDRYTRMTHNQRETKKQRKNSRIKKQKDYLCPESLAMENPTFVPEMVFPDEDPVKKRKDAHDLFMIKLDMPSPMLLPPISNQSTNKDDEDASRTTIETHRRHVNVTHGERQALRARKNEHFHRFKEPTASIMDNGKKNLIYM